MKVDNKDDLVVDFIFCLAVDILTNFSKGVILKEPNQSNIVTYRTQPVFKYGCTIPFCCSYVFEFDKNANSIHIRMKAFCTLRYIGIGLATIGVCVF